MEKICKIMKKCGGCNMLDKPYDKTIEIKKQNVLDCLKNENINTHIDNVIKASNPYEYRNKMIVAFKYENGKVISGFYEEGSHNIVDMDSCIMHTPLQNKIFNLIKNKVKRLRISIYDEYRRRGLLRYVLIREAINTNQILVTFVTSEEMFPGRKELIKDLKAIKEVRTIVQNINNRQTSIVLGEKEKVLYGPGYIEDMLCGLKFRITSKSFYQVNTVQAEKLYNEVVKYSDFSKSDAIIDAYSGIGTIGMIMSSHVKNVISVENNKQAVKAAIEASRINNISNCRFYTADATEFMKDIDTIDAVIMDPPRSGSTVEFLESLIRLSPKKIIYVSCGPDTLARDLKVLLKKYEFTHVSIVDMFCFTKHIETVVVLKIRI